MLNPTNQTELTHADAVEISKTWILLLISGLISVIVGIVILRVNWTKDDLALVVAILFILRGLFRAIVRPIDGSGRGWNVFVGALEVAVGIAFLVWSGPTLLVLAIFIGAWVVVTGIFDFVGGVANRHNTSLLWLFAIFGVIEVILGIILLNNPEGTLALIVLLVGIWSIVVGILQIVVSFEVKHLPKMVK